tara:strand:- start:167 stop:1150 length:984 start_codon:yes stop_codon:yes gene_type:complete
MIIGLVFANTGFGFAEPSTWAYDPAYWAKTENAFPKDLLKSSMNTDQLTREHLAEILVYAYAKATGVGVDALPTGEPFTDTDNVLVGKAYQAGLMTGTTDIQFAPDRVINREALYLGVKKLLLKLEIAPVSSLAAPYSDYSSIPSTIRPTVNYLYSLGVLSGMDSGVFGSKAPAVVEEGLSVLLRVLKTHNWLKGPDLEASSERKTLEGFIIPLRTATDLTIYSPSSVNGIRIYYTGLTVTGSQDEVEKAHRQIAGISERHLGHSYEAVATLTESLEEAWDGVKKQYSTEADIYISGASGAKSSTPLFASNYIKIHSGNRLMVDFVK